MRQLTWDRLDDRVFEVGVDRGVFYNTNGRDGVAWNGLISLTETPSEIDIKNEYQDGIKTFTRVRAQEYKGTLEAYTYPEEFEAYDGLAPVTNGLIIDDQPKRHFNLSYRTKIGNAADGADAGYKIHLLYNIAAIPSARSYVTMNDDAQAATFSWDLTTFATYAPPGFKPSSHYIVDSRRTGALALRHLERILYGWNHVNPRMPSGEQLFTHFNDWHVLYPSSNTYPTETTYPGGP